MKNKNQERIQDTINKQQLTKGLFKSTLIEDKLTISHLSFDMDKLFISFQIKYKNAGKMKLVIRERNMKKEWVENLSLNRDKGDTYIKVNLRKFIEDYYNMVSRWDFYIIEEEQSSSLIREYRLGLYDSPIKRKHERYYEPFKTNGLNTITPYLTIKNGLSLVIKKYIHLQNEKLAHKVKLSKFKMNLNQIIGKVYLELPEVDSYTVRSLFLKYRHNSEVKDYHFNIKEYKKNKTKALIKFSIDLSLLELENYYWDFYIKVDIAGETYYIRIKNPSLTVRLRLNSNLINQSYEYNNGFWVYPYITSINTIALIYKEKEEYEDYKYYIKETLAFYFYLLFKWFYKQKNIWLVFEKFADGAQDNGYYFFKYCYNERKEKKLFYIIKPDSPDIKNLKGMNDRVLNFMSFKYMVYLYAANLLVSSESKNHVYNLRAQKGRLKKALTHKKIVFLQHGVIGLKRIDHIFNKSGPNAVDLFMVSSEYEKKIVMENFLYDDREVVITGLCRWDIIHDQSEGESSVLLMPTWRSWMDDMPKEKFVLTDYYKNYVELLNSNELQNVLDNHKINLNFYIHPKFKYYIDKFNSKNERIKIYQSGDEKLNQLLMKSSMLITDYSSVAWDMYYQKKPVVFYQFDINEYNKHQGSYLNMENDLFGDRAFEKEDLINLIDRYASRSFKEKDKYKKMRDKYFKYNDKKNASRAYRAIMDNEKLLSRKREATHYKKIKKAIKILRKKVKIKSLGKYTI